MSKEWCRITFHIHADADFDVDELLSNGIDPHTPTNQNPWVAFLTKEFKLVEEISSQIDFVQVETFGEN